jgi:ribonuclease BN (tRNA processing enzyme)
MGASMTFHDLQDGQVIDLTDGNGGSIRITTAPGNHPNGVRAFRADHAGKSVMYATDTEHYPEIDKNLLGLAKNVDVLIYDSQYTPEEYAGTAGTGTAKVGWGHSTFAEAAKLAKAANAKQLVLYHHDPMQPDAAVREKERRARELFAASVAAYEGLVIDL